MVRRQRWCDLRLLLDDLEEQGVLTSGPVTSESDEYWGGGDQL